MVDLEIKGQVKVKITSGSPLLRFRFALRPRRPNYGAKTENKPL
jgi:hypothetical protein